MPFVVEPVRRPEEEPSAFLQEARLKLDTGHMPGVDRWTVDRDNQQVLLSVGGGRQEAGDVERSRWKALDRHGRYWLVSEEQVAERDRKASSIRKMVKLGVYRHPREGYDEPGTETLQWVAAALKVFETDLQSRFYRNVRVDVVDAVTGEAL